MALGTTELVLAISLVLTLVVAKFLFFPSKPERPRNVSFGALGVPQAGKAKQAEDENAAARKPMTIFYGSQSGTAETFATEMIEEAKAYGFNGKAIDLEDYDEEDLKDEPFAVFLMATFGEGEPTDNAQRFCTWIKSNDREPGQLENLPFAVFALGNRQYEHYCLIGRQVDKHLGKLGGLRIIDHGEGDDDGSLEDDYNDWKTKFFEAAQAHFGAESGEASDITEFKPTVDLVIDEDLTPADVTFIPDEKHASSAAWAPVKSNYELRQCTKDGGSTVHVELDISDCPSLQYVTADNLGVFPRNDFKPAAQLAKRLGVNPNSVFRLNRTADTRKMPFPTPISVRDALMYHCDMTTPPRKQLLKILAGYTSDIHERAKIVEATTDAGWEVFKKHNYTLLETLQMFPTLDIPLVDFVELMPKLAPRFYTISSSSKHDPDSLSVTVSLLREPKTNGREHIGVCSSYLKRLRPGKDKLCCFVRESTFRLPDPVSKDSNTRPPVVMVGPGTGVAPFRAFLQEATWINSGGDAAKIEDLSLYFGCKRSDADWIYRDEMQTAESKSILDSLRLAFSREKDEKVYVQHHLKEDGKSLWDKIHHQKGSFYVCGGTSMGRSVREVLAHLAQEHGGMSAEQGDEYVKQLQEDKRFVQELWS